MDEATRKRLEYEEQIFPFSSQFVAESFKDFLRDVIESSLDKLVNHFHKRLILESRNPDYFNESVKEMKYKLLSKYNESLEVEFRNIQQKITKCMMIPNHVLLKEDLPVKAGLTVNITVIDEEIKILKKKYKALSYMKQKMHEEIEMADSVIFILDNIIDKNEIDIKVLDVNHIYSLCKSNLYFLNNKDIFKSKVK